MKNITIALICLLAVSCASMNVMQKSEQQDEVTVLIKALGGGYYIGPIEQGQLLSQAVKTQSPELLIKFNVQLAAIGALLAEDHQVKDLFIDGCWPSSHGVRVSLFCFVQDSSESGLNIKSATAVVLIPIKITIDPDRGKTKKELYSQYGYSSLKECSKNALMEVVLFMASIKQGKQPYVLNDSLCSLQTKGQCFGLKFESGIKVIQKIADRLGNRNGVATPWEMESLVEKLPILAELAAGKQLPCLFSQEISDKGAKYAYAQLINLPEFADQVIVY